MKVKSNCDYLQFIWLSIQKVPVNEKQLELIKIIQEGDRLKKFTKLSYNLELPVEKDTGSSFHPV